MTNRYALATNGNVDHFCKGSARRVAAVLCARTGLSLPEVNARLNRTRHLTTVVVLRELARQYALNNGRAPHEVTIVILRDDDTIYCNV
jgi:hypothetical protein